MSTSPGFNSTKFDANLVIRRNAHLVLRQSTLTVKDTEGTLLHLHLLRWTTPRGWVLLALLPAGLGWRGAVLLRGLGPLGLSAGGVISVILVI